MELALALFRIVGAIVISVALVRLYRILDGFLKTGTAAFEAYLEKNGWKKK